MLNKRRRERHVVGWAKVFISSGPVSVAAAGLALWRVSKTERNTLLPRGGHAPLHQEGLVLCEALASDELAS